LLDRDKEYGIRDKTKGKRHQGEREKGKKGKKGEKGKMGKGDKGIR
jgi:hypothetical protein